MSTDNDLNRAISRLCGWRECLVRSTNLMLPPGCPIADHVPRYDTDPAAALTLLDHTLRQKLYDRFLLSVCEIRYDPATGLWTMAIEAVRPNGFVPDVMTGTGDNWYGEGETLSLAIARVCQDVLVALKEGETT